MSSSLEESMTAWKINDYKGLKSLKLVEGLPIPKLTSSKDVLVEVKAASLNVMDILMADGYARVAFGKFFRQKLPLTLGRDFAGIVRAVGKEVNEIKVGDEVMGVVPPQSGTDGSHAQFVVVTDSCVVLKPSNLTMIEAASLPYAGLTAWCSLASLSDTHNRDVKVLVMGAAGGVGSIAIQLCKLWGCLVVSTCATDAVSIIEPLGSGPIIDYKSPDADSRLKKFGGFNMVLDCTGPRMNYDLTLLKPWANAKYLALRSPLLGNLDNYGVIGGLLKSVWDFLATNAWPILKLKTIRWVLFKSNHSALVKIRDFAQQEKLKPLVESVIPYDRTPDAYIKMKAGHSRGKIVIAFPN